MTITATERQFLLSQVVRMAQRDLNQLWGAVSRMSGAEFHTYMVTAFPELADPFVSMAAQLAATWFELSDPTSPYIAVTAPPVPIEKLATSADWALGATGEAGRDRLAGTLQRAVYDGARETTRINVERTGSSWAVHARPGACPWCRMMATRGAVYRSGATALASCHDNGHCVAMEDRDGSYQPPSYLSQWDEEYLKARAEAGSSDPKQILAAWRQLDTTHAK